MATITQNVLVLADGYDLSCHLRSVEVSQETDMLDSTALCTTGARSFNAGLTERTVTGEGYFNYNSATDALGADSGFNAEFSATANRIITIGPSGSTTGNPAWLMNTKQANYSISETVGDLIMANFEAKATLDGTEYGWAAPGYVLLSQAVTGTVNGTSVDDGAGATTGYIAHCHVTADDFTSMTVKVQHSTDNSSWSDLATFSVFSAVGADQVANTATSVNRYVRAIVSAFTGTSATVHVALKTGFTG